MARRLSSVHGQPRSYVTVDRKDGGSRNVGNSLPDDMGSCPRRHEASVVCFYICYSRFVSAGVVRLQNCEIRLCNSE
jgi:hypothetical protein